MIKLLVSLCVATLALADPWGGYGYLHGHRGYVGYLAPGLVQHHAGGGHSFQSGTHLGKRSAEPHGFLPFYHHGYHHVHHPGSATLADGELSVTHPGGGTSTVSGHSLGKRSADPHGFYLGHHGFHGYYHGLHHEHPAPAGLDTTATVEHPNGGTSTVSGHPLGKRSASPHGYYHLLPFHHGYHLGAPVKALAEPGTAVHPGGATSYVARSAQGAGRKRREASPTIWGLHNGHGGFIHHEHPAGLVTSVSVEHPNGGTSTVSGHSLGKRSAEPIVWGLRNGHGGFVGQAIPAHGHGYLHHGYYGYIHG